jgi:hypothetical protein
MGFDDLFEDNRKRSGHYREHGYRDDNSYTYDSHHSFSGHGEQMKWTAVLDKIRNDKKLKMIVIIAGIFILVIAATLVVAFLPLIMKLLNYISQNGLQGIVDGITGFLDKLWKGSGK